MRLFGMRIQNRKGRQRPQEGEGEVQAKLALPVAGALPLGLAAPPAPPAAPALPLARLAISGAALAALRWSAERSENECCFWGVLEAAADGLRLRRADLARHQGAPAYTIPDMEWYGDWVLERHASEGLEPWQLACWIHTHPDGLAQPSGTDHATFREHFGRQRLALMLIMSHDLRFYGELSANLPPLPGLPPARLAGPLQLSLEETKASLSQAESESLERQWRELVSPLHPGPRACPGAPYSWWEEDAWWPEEDGDGAFAGLEEEEPDFPLLPAGRWTEPETLGHSQSEAVLAQYLQRFQREGAAGQPELDPAALDLELIADWLASPHIRVSQAARLRERLRSLAHHLGWKEAAQ